MDRSRAFWAVAVLALTTATSGCWVLDEIDSASAGPGAGRPPAKAADSSPSAHGGAGGPSASQRWWSELRSLDPGDADASIVACRLRGSVLYTQIDDCRSRGGVPSG